MAGDYTRFSFKAKKNYSGVFKQQGRVSLDADWNEQSEIYDRHLRSETIDIIGRGVVAGFTADAFRVIPTGLGTFNIGIGRIYVDGLQAECHGLDPQKYDPILGELRGTTPVPYDNQLHYPDPLPLDRPELPPIPGRTDLVYLDVRQREITAIEDPGLKEIALGGPDTTTRAQIMWQVKVMEDVGDARCSDPIGRWNDEVKPSAAQLTTSTIIPPSEEGPCIISPAGGYRGLENRLYRAEIHTPGSLATAKFKWSRNNCSVVSAVESISGDQITVRQLGRDQVLRFNVGGWVEIVDDHREFAGSAGQMAKITNIDEGNRILTVDRVIGADFDANDLSRHTRVRQWNQRSGVDSNGLLDVIAGPIDIEDGIQISFSIDTDNPTGEFKIGDHWGFHARTADGSVEPLENAPPRGIKHHYCRLGLITWETNIEPTKVRDCRNLWPPAHCCPTVRPGEDIQAAIDKVPVEGGCICLLPGIHRIDRPLFIDGRKNLTIVGSGAATKLVYSPTATTDPALAALYIIGASRNIEVKEFLVHADILENLVFIDELSEEISIDGCILVNGLDRRNTACILLGECCKVAATNSRLIGARGIVQADSHTLEQSRAALLNLHALSQSEEEDTDNEKPEPVKVPALRELHVAGNAVFFAATGVDLHDVLSGDISSNGLHAITRDKLDTFRRPSEQPTEAAGVIADVTDFYILLEHNLAALSSCPKSVKPEGEQPEVDRETPDIPERTIGISACVMEDFDLQSNKITAEAGIVLLYSRAVNTVHNKIRVGLIGISLNYGFEAGVQDNIIHIADNPPAEQEEENPWYAFFRERFRTGNFGIGLRFVRGIKIKNNNIDAHSAIGSWSRNWKLCKDIQTDSLLRVLRIEHPWRVIMELAWFLYQIFRMFSIAVITAPNENEAAANVIKSKKEKFEQSMLKRFARLLGSRYIPYFIGKAEIVDNRLHVSRFGLFFHKIFSVSGLRILGNRISGFSKKGIFIHPWHSIGFVDKFAKAIRCLFTWFIRFLDMLKDALDNFPGNATPSDQPTEEGGILGIMTMGISWILTLCSNYCSGGTPPEDEGEEERPPSHAEILRDALDDFHKNINLAWLDDLVNQCYEIDSNVLAGAGDGIWMGLDSARITNNYVTVWPGSTVPHETVIFGTLLKHHFEHLDNTGEYKGHAQISAGIMELDRDMLLFASYSESQDDGWLNSSIDNATFRERFGVFLNELVVHIDPASDLIEPVTNMRAGLDENNSDRLKKAWITALLTMLRNMTGYGIVMMGANMVCKGNRVIAKTGCNDPFARQRYTNNVAEDGAYGYTTISTLSDGRKLIFNSQAIGGIWQFSNFASILTDLLDIVFSMSIKRRSGNLIYDLLMTLVAFFILLQTDKRNICIVKNDVEGGLVHGIRTIPVVGLEVVEILDNCIRDASRHGIYHAGDFYIIIDMFSDKDDESIYVKVHRNTINKEEWSPIFKYLHGRQGHDFSSLIRIENADGTTLMSQNHGDADRGLAGQNCAVFVDSSIVGITDNHMRVNALYAFEIITTENSMFTHNMHKPNSNDISPNSIIHAPNVSIP